MMSLRVGAALSQTGIYALQGRQARQGLSLWVAECNATGGLYVPDLDRTLPLELVLYDDHSRRAEMAPLIDRLIEHDRVHFLIGPYSSGLTYAAAAVAEAHAKVMWNHGGSSDAIMQQGWRWLINVPTPASRYFAGIFPSVAEQLARGDRVAIIQRRRSAFATEVATGTRDQAERAGFAPLPALFYPESPAEMPILARQLVAINPAIIVGVGRYTDDIGLARALADLRFDANILAAVATPMQAFRADLQQAAEGWMGPSQWEPESPALPDVGPTSAAFVERYQEHFQEPPDYPAAQAYAAGVLLQRCLALAGTYRDVEMQRYARELVCRTFYGQFQLDPESGVQIGHETVLIQWQAGIKRIIWPPDLAQTGPVDLRSTGLR